MELKKRKIDLFGLVGLILTIIGLITTYPFWSDLIKSDYDIKIIQADKADQTKWMLLITNNKEDKYIKEIIYFDQNIENIIPVDTTNSENVISYNDNSFKYLKYKKPVIWEKNQVLEYDLILTKTVDSYLVNDDIKIKLHDDTFIQNVNIQKYNNLSKALVFMVIILLCSISLFLIRIYLLRKKVNLLNFQRTDYTNLEEIINKNISDYAEIKSKKDGLETKIKESQEEVEHLRLVNNDMEYRLLTETGNIKTATDIIDKIILKTKKVTINGNILKKKIFILTTDSLESKDYIPIGLFITWTTIVRIWLQNKKLSAVKETTDSYCQYDKIKSCSNLVINNRLRTAINNAIKNYTKIITIDQKFKSGIQSTFHSSTLDNDSDFLIARIIIGTEEDLLRPDNSVLINFYESFHIPIFFIDIQKLDTKAKELKKESINFWYNGSDNDLFIVDDEYFEGYMPNTPSWNRLDTETIEKYFNLLEDKSLETMLAYDAKQIVLHKKNNYNFENKSIFNNNG